MSTIKKHIKTTYTTSDGKTFGTKKEAEKWQNIIDQVDNIVMLDSTFNKVYKTPYARYLKIENQDQRIAFNNMSIDEGFSSSTDLIPKPGYYRYKLDRYSNIDDEIESLLEIKNKLDTPIS